MVNALEAFKTFVESVVSDACASDGVVTTSRPSFSLQSTFYLTGRKASDLWSSCLELRSQYNDAGKAIDKSQLIDFSLNKTELANGPESTTATTAMTVQESINLLQSFIAEAEKERARAVNRLKRFGSSE